MFLTPPLRYKFSCEYDSYTVTIQSPPPTGHGLVYPFELYSYTNPYCRDKKTNQNATHNWLTTMFKGDCGVTQEVRLCFHSNKWFTMRDIYKFDIFADYRQ